MEWLQPALTIAMAVVVVLTFIAQNRAFTAYRRAVEAASRESFQVGVLFAVDYAERGATKEAVIGMAGATIEREDFHPALVGHRLIHSPSSSFYIGHTAKECPGNHE